MDKKNEALSKHDTSYSIQANRIKHQATALS